MSIVTRLQDKVKIQSESEIKRLIKEKMDKFFKDYFEQEIFVQGNNWRDGNKMSIQQYMDDYIEGLMSKKSCGQKIPSVIQDYISNDIRSGMDRIKRDMQSAIDKAIKREITNSEAAKFLKKLREKE